MKALWLEDATKQEDNLVLEIASSSFTRSEGLLAMTGENIEVKLFI
jgi:hypothetical protein